MIYFHKIIRLINFMKNIHTNLLYLSATDKQGAVNLF